MVTTQDQSQPSKSATYSPLVLKGLGYLPHLSLLRLNYKSRPIDQTVVDFFSTSCHNLSVLHLFDVKDIHMDDLRLTVGQCKVTRQPHKDKIQYLSVHQETKLVFSILTPTLFFLSWHKPLQSIINVSNWVRT